MSRGKELIENTVIIAIGNISTKILIFFLLPLYTSILSTDDYGIYDLLITFAAFITPIVTLLLEESMFRFLIDCKSNEEKKDIISHVIIFSLISISIFISFYLFVSLFVNIPFYNIFLLYIITSIMLTLTNSLSRGLGKIKVYTFSNFVSSLLILFLNILLIVKLKYGIESLLISSIVSNFSISVFVFFRLNIKKYITLKGFNKNKMLEMIKYSFPLIPNSLSWNIINLSDRIIISNVLGLSFNGIYSMANKFPCLMDTIYGFFYTSWRENATKFYKDNDSNLYYNKVYSILRDFMWSIVIVIIVVLPFIFEFFIKNEFVQSYVYIPILILAMYFSNMSGFFGGIFSAYKNTKIMGFSSMLGAIINLIINIFLIKYIGLWAASLSTLVATLTIYLYRKKVLNKYIDLNDNLLKKNLSYLSLLVAILSYYTHNIIIRISIFLVVLIYIYYINREIINYFITFFKSKFIKRSIV